MRSTIFLYISLFLLGACTSNTIYKKPDDLIPKNQMVDLLTDMYIAKASSNIKTKKMERNIEYMTLILDKYGVDSLRFQNSNLYYMSRIDDYEVMHKKIAERLKKMLDSTENKQMIADSLTTSKKEKLELRKDK